MHCQRYRTPPVSRREMLRATSCGFGATALTALSQEYAEAAPQSPLAPKASHFAAKAKSVIFLYMDGGPSHVDTFDYKPLLEKLDGQDPRKAMGKLEPTQFNNIGKVMKSPWKFKQYGESGRWVSDLFPNISRHVDDLAFLQGMTSNFSEHTFANL